MPASSSRLAALPVVLFLALAVGCTIEPVADMHSGTIDAPYTEEALPEDCEHWRPALETSNQLVELIRERNWDALHSKLEPEFKSRIPLESVETNLENILSKIGEIEEYKPNQWAFSTRTESGQAILYSTKIVIHREQTVLYMFRFVGTGDSFRFTTLTTQQLQDGERLTSALRRHL